jgi:hypothetical protein
MQLVGAVGCKLAKSAGIVSFIEGKAELEEAGRRAVLR